MNENQYHDIDWKKELTSFLEKQQKVLINFSISMLCVIALVILFSKQVIPNSIEAIGMFIVLVSVSVFLYFFQEKSYDFTAWSLVAMSLILPGYFFFFRSLPNMALAFFLPVGLATLLASVPAGAVMAVFITGLLAFHAFGFGNGWTNIDTFGLFSSWSVYLLTSLALNPLVEAITWAFSGYEHSRELLAESREYQIQLNQSLDDLGNLNEQLVRMNRLAQDLRQIAEEERQAKGQFVANVSHELRTPLNMIIGFSEMILDAPETYGRSVPATLLADLATIHRNSQHLSSLVDDVLDLSQIEAQEMTLSKEWLSPAEIVESANATVRPLFESKKLFLKTDIPDELPMVYCDRTRMREVMINLLSNAGRFTNVGGVNVQLKIQNGTVLFSVTDTGPGISEENQARLFEPFHQLDGSIRRQYGGSGLGLSISKRFVELHEGKMWVSSIFGKGTTFYFTLPFTNTVPMGNSPLRWINNEWEYRQRTRPMVLQPVKIQPRFVVLDEDGFLLPILSRVMQNVDLMAAATMDEMMPLLKTGSVQAVLINQTENFSANAILAEIKNLDFVVPVFGCKIQNPIELVKMIGADAYLIKPVSKAHLYTLLDRLCPQAGTILIADDETEVVRLYHRMLAARKKEYRILTAPNGQISLELMREYHPDCVLLDLSMPEKDGMEVLREKMSDASMDGIKVIITSAHDPVGNVVVSQSLWVTKENGLSVRQMVSSIESLTQVLAPNHWSNDSIMTEDPSV